jgi:tripartite ATP-independent transporter DctP family solute receptor
MPGIWIDSTLAARNIRKTSTAKEKAMKKSVQSGTSSTGRRTFLRWAAATTGAASLGIGGPALAQRARVFRFGHMLPIDTPYHKAIQLFADEASKLSSGRIKIDIYPSSQLGTIPEMLSATQVGSLTLTMTVPAWYSNFMKPIDAFTLPYIVSSADRLKASLDGTLGKEITRLGEAAGFHVLGYWLIGGRHIVNKIRPVNKPADCQGLKLRVINSQVYIQAFRALGASTVALDPSELYVALQQGVVDGFEYPLPDLVSVKLYEVSKYLSLDQHTTDFFIISINKGVWEGLPPEDQAVLAKAMLTAMDWQWKAQPEEIATALAKLKTLMTVNDITPENKKLFVDATRPIYKQFEPSIGKEFLELAIKELG